MAAKKKRSEPRQEDFDDVPEFTDFGDLGDLRGLAEVGDIEELRRILATAVSRDDVDKAPPKRSLSDAAAEPPPVGKQGRRDKHDREGKPTGPEKPGRPEKAPQGKNAAAPAADELDDEEEDAPKPKAAPKAKKVERPLDAPPKRPAFRSEDDKAAAAELRRLAAKGLLPTRGKAAELAAEKLREKEKEKEKDKGRTSRDGVAVTPVGLRIIGGKYRRKRLEYGGDQTVRPMKDRVREALFNLLGTEIEGLHAFDLFAGTGAIGLEALSRGAAKATFVERHFPTADVLRANIKILGAQGETEVFSSDTFYWWLRTHVQDSAPRAIFVCPPYDLFESRREDLEKMIRQAIEQAAPGSICVVESDERWSASPLFDDLGDWDVREYPPARIAILRKE